MKIRPLPFLPITLPIVLVLFFLLMQTRLNAAEYRIDTEGAHASIHFRIKHLGYSWLTGRFNDFTGTFSYDEKQPEKSSIQLTVHTRSLDSNHAERDKHLRGKKFLHVKKFPTATFISTRYQPTGKSTGTLSGQFTLHGVTHPVSMKVIQTGAGKDPWGGFRRGFETRFTIRLHDYAIQHDLGPESEELELTIYLEGIKDDKYFFEN